MQTPPPSRSGSADGKTALRLVEIVDDNELDLTDTPVPLDPLLAQQLDSSEISNQYFLSRVLQDQLVRDEFQRFLESRHCAENLMFWVEVEKFKKIDPTKQDRMKEKARDIYEKYMCPTEFEVNLPYKLRQSVLRSLESPTTEMFQSCQRTIFLLMLHGTFDYFLKSEEYRKFKVIQVRKESVCESPPIIEKVARGVKQTQISNNKKTKNFLGINFKRTKTPDPSGRVSTPQHPLPSST